MCSRGGSRAGGGPSTCRGQAPAGCMGGTREQGGWNAGNQWGGVYKKERWVGAQSCR